MKTQSSISISMMWLFLPLLSTYHLLLCCLRVQDHDAQVHNSEIWSGNICVKKYRHKRKESLLYVGFNLRPS